MLRSLKQESVSHSLGAGECAQVPSLESFLVTCPIFLFCDCSLLGLLFTIISGLSHLEDHCLPLIPISKARCELSPTGLPLLLCLPRRALHARQTDWLLAHLLCACSTVFVLRSSCVFSPVLLLSLCVKLAIHQGKRKHGL